MTRVAILTPTLTAADAVSNDVLAMQSLLAGRGHEVQVFAEHANVEGKKIAQPSAAKSFLRDWQDVLIYHHSIGWKRGIETVKNASCRKIIRYHNVTPPQFFAGISEEHQRLCANGRTQLLDIVEFQPDLYLAASDFNKTDLIAAGSEEGKTFVVPPFNHADKLQAGEADLDVLDQYCDGTINLVTVGGVRPNKSHGALIKAFVAYLRLFNSNARLFIVGSENDAFANYTASLRELINAWAIHSSVVFTGKVSNESLKAYYLLADALLMTSEHEGFCVPLVEAMAMKVPIIAYGSTAIPETAGESGLILDRRDPFLMAQSIDNLRTNEAAKMALVSRGAQRYEERFSNGAIAKRFLEVMASSEFKL
jgi:glycosyltransferase involved in cell wall biosynthesis